MPRPRPLWSWTVGPRGARVTAAERSLGGAVYLLTYDKALGGYRKRSVGFPVRDALGRVLAEHEARAKALASELSTRLIRGEVPGATLTFGALVNTFRREVVAGQTVRHAADTERELALWLGYLGGGFDVARLGLREWNAFRRQRASGEVDSAGANVADPQARRPVRARAVAKSLKVLRHVCRFATLYRTSGGRFLLEADPTRGLEIPEEANPKRPRADPERFAPLLAVAPRVRMSTASGERVPSYVPQLLTLAYHTGRRISAILALRWSDWRAAEKPYGAIFWRAAHDKIGRDWLTPVRPEVRSCLEAFQRERLGLGDVLLFPSAADPGRPVDHHLATAWLRQAEKLAGLAPLQGGAWHPFRRAWATARKGLSLKDVAEAGGWKDTTTLLKCYAQADPETIAAVVMHEAAVRAVR